MTFKKDSVIEVRGKDVRLISRSNKKYIIDSILKGSLKQVPMN